MTAQRIALERDGHDDVCVRYWPFNLQTFLWPFDPTDLERAQPPQDCQRTCRQAGSGEPRCVAYHPYRGKH